jgi:hypothetical protein
MNQLAVAHLEEKNSLDELCNDGSASIHLPKLRWFM